MNDAANGGGVSTPGELYAQGVAQGRWEDDPAQRAALVELDRVHADLQAGVVSVAEEALEDVGVEGELAGAGAVDVWVADGRGAGTDRPVGREVATDRLEAELHSLGHVHHAKDDLHGHRQIGAVREEGVEIQLGSLDDAPFELRPQAELWIKRREPWIDEVEGASQHEGNRH